MIFSDPEPTFQTIMDPDPSQNQCLKPKPKNVLLSIKNIHRGLTMRMQLDFPQLLKQGP